MSTPSVSMSRSRSCGSLYPGRPHEACRISVPPAFAFAALPPSISRNAWASAAS